MKFERDFCSILNGRNISEIPSLPDNVAQYFNEYYCTIEVSICHTDVECGYGCRISRCFKVLRPYCKCSRCGYHSLWNPDDTQSKCLRHTYTRGWDTVFAYMIDTGETKPSLEVMFDEFLKKQPDSDYLPVVSLFC